MRLRLWPRSLLGQMLLAVALALLLVQGIGALLIYRAQEAGREAALIHAAAFRLIAASRGVIETDNDGRASLHFPGSRGPAPRRSTTSPLAPGEKHDLSAEAELAGILAEQGVAAERIVVIDRAIARDPASIAHLRNRRTPRAEHMIAGGEVMVAAVKRPGGDWLVARVFDRPGVGALVLPLFWQTVLIYLVVVGAMALILRRSTRPLAALKKRLDSFADTRSLDGQVPPQGPEDVRRLIEAHNAMEARIAGLIDEKDVMLGAIGHDLKTPLAALRVRIESVEDEIERERMAMTIEDIVRTLDDILSLARVGRPSDPRERSEISALVASVIEEYEDMGAPVEFGDTVRVAAPVRATWLRRALRNLVGNALRYGGGARVSVAKQADAALIRIEDDGPGIPEAEIERMMDPFTRGEPSRNSETGGAGLGLALARAIAEQHGGRLALSNRRSPEGKITGFSAALYLPLA